MRPPIPDVPTGRNADARVLALVRAGYTEHELATVWRVSHAWVRYCCERAEAAEGKVER